MLNVLKNVAKLGVVMVGAAAVGELGFLGTNMVFKEGEQTVEICKELKNPTVYAVKEKGIFGKKYNVTVNPLTGTEKKYTGSKKPVNKKPIIVAKAKKNA